MFQQWVKHGGYSGWTSSSSHCSQLFPFTGVPCFLWAELVTTLDAVKSLMMSFLQTGNLSGVDGRLSYAGDRRARWKWSSSEKRLRRCYYPCKPKAMHHFWMQHLCKVYYYFFPENMQGKIVFQSDLINDGKQFTGPVLLLWMEEGGESSSGQNPYATLHNWSLLCLVSKLCRLAAAFLSSVAKLLRLIISFSYCH